jgi:hypothetical protein
MLLKHVNFDEERRIKYYIKELRKKGYEVKRTVKKILGEKEKIRRRAEKSISIILVSWSTIKISWGTTLKITDEELTIHALPNLPP